MSALLAAYGLAAAAFALFIVVLVIFTYHEATR
jgi:hypothetical protein